MPIAQYDENTDPRTPRYPILSALTAHHLLVTSRQDVGRVVAVAELRETGSEDAELRKSWRELRTAALTVGQAANSVSALLCPPPPVVPRYGWGWLVKLLTVVGQRS